MVLDGVTVLAAAILATLYHLRVGPPGAEREFLQGTLLDGRSMAMLLALLCGLIGAIILTSHRLHLYYPARLHGYLQEQRLTAQACLVAGLLLIGTIYLIRASYIPRSIVLITLGLVGVSLGLRRLVYRAVLYRNFERGIGTRSVLIVGTGPEAEALRRQMERDSHLGYTFKGFFELPGGCSQFPADSDDAVGNLDTLFQNARRQFVDEIFFTAPCERGVVQDAQEKARARGINLRLVPDTYDGLAWSSPIEYIGPFPTIPLYFRKVPEVALVLKRTLDIVFSILVIIGLAPLVLAIAIAIKLDSRGPVFYSSDRIGKKGRVFRCTKFRTMVCGAEERRAAILPMNERDGVLFKVSHDPRTTRVGRFLRKYSLDELPQFFSVLRGEMSIVGPRPPIASEVREYKLGHLRRLEAIPGITGLWQVQARRDPSFDSYISLDVSYIENWSIWLDVKIILRTIGVVLAGTGS